MLLVPETLFFALGESVMLWTLKYSGAFVTVGSFAAATTLRTVVVGGGGVCAAAETATTIAVKRIPVVVNRMMSSRGSRYISLHIAKLQALAGATFDLGWPPLANCQHPQLCRCRLSLPI